jgi:O-methyltransferase
LVLSSRDISRNPAGSPQIDPTALLRGIGLEPIFVGVPTLLSAYSFSMQNPIDTVIEMSMSYAVPRCLHVLAEMGVADALEDEALTAADLAARTAADSGALARALQLLAAYGIFERRGDGYVHTPASRLLRTDHPQSLRSFVRWIGDPLCWKSFEVLGHSVRTGEMAVDQVTPGGFWAYLAQHPEVRRIFDESMTAKAHGQIFGILSSYDFSHFQTIADIGGGRGHLLNAVLDAAPNVTGVLFDQPHVVEDLAGMASDRLRVQGGDFFKDSLPVCDAYIIMQVIHDWNDAQALEILNAIRRAAPTHARLLLIEAIVSEDSEPSWVNTMDLFMLAMTGGKERTRREFEDLLSKSGFRLENVVDVGLGTSLLDTAVV